MLHRFEDIHCHDRSRAASGAAIVNIVPGEDMAPGGYYSVGIHPWSTAEGFACADLRKLVAMAHDERVLAIGEAGYDRLRGADIALQDSVFRFQARLAARVGKPLIIHCVKSFDLLLKAARELRPAPGMWIVHGFRGKPALARQLLDAGLALSYGHRYNPDAMAITPPERLYRETDAPATNQ